MPLSVSIIEALNYLVRFIELLVFVRIIFSWINPNPHNPIVAFVYNVTEPILGPVRNLIYNKLGYSGMIDFSPIVAIFLLNIIYGRLVLPLLISLLF
ncbi:YggT family protein [Alkaliphilus hydrothermalis]|uniref:YggT family protein n=1 Tax=Alkaliphilus hydrothermalis TaxID=1482730 RepID=A0ABS2NNK9_9FIRM|nr:YggT family protein [Alkaliphilus hydrothermalis]MBM7614535.1 YggT family protein [Alkaliphilus hydrothermalis]